jgi:FixJ family two-component response regulator
MGSEPSRVRTSARAVVAVVDDADSVRESLPDLLRELGYEARAFASAEEFLASEGIGEVQCMILDIGLPGLSGPELQRELILMGHEIATIFITGRSQRSIPPDLIAQGKIECLFKPFSEEDLRAVLDAALARAG